MDAITVNVVKAGLDAHNGNLGNGYMLGEVTSGDASVPPIVDEGRGKDPDGTGP